MLPSPDTGNHSNFTAKTNINNRAVINVGILWPTMVKTITVLSKGEFLFTAQRIPKGIVIASPINIAKYL